MRWFQTRMTWMLCWTVGLAITITGGWATETLAQESNLADEPAAIDEVLDMDTAEVGIPLPPGIKPRHEAARRPQRLERSAVAPRGLPPAAQAPHRPISDGLPKTASQDSKPGDRLAIAAHQKSTTASTAEAYTQVIELCQQALQAGTSVAMGNYPRELLAWALNRRGEARAEGGQHQQALSDFEAAVQNDMNCWRAWHNRGVSYADLGRRNEAIRDFHRVVKLNPEFLNAFFNRAELYYESGDFQEALRDYSHVVQKSPKDVEARNGRGHCLHQLGKYREAVVDFTLAAKFDPTGTEALVNRGDLYSQLGFYRYALRDFQRAIEIDSESARAHLGVAWLMATCPDPKFRDAKTAIEVAMEAVKLSDPSDHRCYDTLAAALANAGRFEQARKAIEKAVRIAPEELADVYQSRLVLYESERALRVAKTPLPGLDGVTAREPIEQSTFEAPPQPE